MQPTDHMSTAVEYFVLLGGRRRDPGRIREYFLFFFLLLLFIVSSSLLLEEGRGDDGIRAGGDGGGGGGRISSSGARYHNVTTNAVYLWTGSPYFLARPKSHTVSCILQYITTQTSKPAISHGRITRTRNLTQSGEERKKKERKKKERERERERKELIRGA